MRPFRLDELEHIPAEQRDIQQALLRAMPEALFQRGFTKQITELLKSFIGLEVDLWFDGYRVYETKRLRALIPGTTCIFVVGLAPREEKLLVELDLQFAYRVIAELFGTKGASMDVQRPLTEIEQGVLLFVALKVIALVQSRWTHAEQLAFRIDDIRCDIRSVADVLRYENTWLAANWKLFFGLDVGFVRVLMPERLARGVVLKRPPADSELGVRTRNRIRRRLAALGPIVTEAVVEVGSLELGRSDLEQLDVGDIVLLESTELALQADGGVAGSTMLRIGLGRHGGFRGTVRTEDGAQVFEIESVVIEEVPEVHDPQMGHGEHENPEELVASYEAYSSEGNEEAFEAYEEDESSTGGSSAEDLYDEDHGLDDEDHSGDEGYEYDEEGQEEGGEEGEGYDDGEGYEGEEEAPEPESEEDNLAASEPLLGDIPMVCVVELGRVQLTADEVIRLRSGQLIELGRAPTDPVDLVVNGKLVAKGELVEIEGSLGVKLIALVQGEE